MVGGYVSLFGRPGQCVSSWRGNGHRQIIRSVVCRNAAAVYRAAPPEQTGWLAGVRDPDIGTALAALHRAPAEPWTIASLAAEVGLSRSVLAERFRRYLSETPIAYLTRWRLQLGAQLLASTNRSVAEIAAEVGYESEPAFNRAFKREFDLPPARFRSRSKADRDTAARGETSSKGTRSSGG